MKPDPNPKKAGPTHLYPQPIAAERWRSRVTRLGELSPVERLFTFYYISTVMVVLIWAKNDILGEFLLNPSGVDVMIAIFCDFCQFSAK
jgi:hypothetical protein